MIRWKTVAYWPEEVKGLGTFENTSEDTHDNKGQADGVARLLFTEGFGGNRKYFPLKVAVIPILPPDLIVYIKDQLHVREKTLMSQVAQIDMTNESLAKLSKEVETCFDKMNFVLCRQTGS